MTTIRGNFRVELLLLAALVCHLLLAGVFAFEAVNEPSNLHEAHLHGANCAGHADIEQPKAVPLARSRRQVVNPNKPAESGSSILSMLGELGPQVEKAKMFTSMFSSSSSGAAQANQQPASSSPGQLMSSLSELIRSTQDRSAKTLADTQQAAQQVAQQQATQTAQAAQSAQGGIQAALSEIGSGLQRIATNNPSLLPDVKSLYQSVSNKLSSASSSVAQVAPIGPASGGEQLADNLAKAVSSGQIVSA